LRITRVLAPDDYGVFTFLAMQGMLLLTIGDLGIRNIIIRSIARDKERTNDLMYNGVLLKTLSILFLSLLYIGYNSWFGSLSAWQLSLLFIFSLISCFSNLFENAFLGHEKMLPPALGSLVHSVLWFTAVYTLPVELISPNLLFVVFVVLHAMKAMLFYWFLRHYDLLQGQVQSFWRSTRTLLRESWPYFALVLVMLPFTKLSNNFLDINSNLEQVGYYNLADKLVGPVSLVLDLALAAIFPNLSSLWVKDKDRFNQFISTGFRYFMLLSMLLCFVFTLYVEEVVIFLFPASYLPAVPVCQIQIWLLFLLSVDSFIGTILGATDKEKLILRLGIVHSLFATPILYYGSNYGALGLSYGQIFSFTVFQLYLWYVFRKALKIKVQHRNILWLIAGFLFVVSYFSYLVPTDYALTYKIVLTVCVLGIAGIYVLRTLKLAEVK